MVVEQVVGIPLDVASARFEHFFIITKIVERIVHLVADFAQFFGLADLPAVGAHLFYGQGLAIFIQCLKVLDVASEIIFGIGAGYNFGQVVHDFVFFERWWYQLYADLIISNMQQIDGKVVFGLSKGKSTKQHQHNSKEYIFHMVYFYSPNVKLNSENGLTPNGGI